MDKMGTEFATGTVRGPFTSKEALRFAIQTEIRKNPGFEGFILKLEWSIISLQFSVEEFHAYEEASLEVEVQESSMGEKEVLNHSFKVRNIWNSKKLLMC